MCISTEKRIRIQNSYIWVLALGSVQFISVQSLSHVRLLATPWIAACQASLSIINSWSLPKLMSNQSVRRRRRRRQRHPTPALLPGKSHGQRGLVGCNPWGREESDTTEDFTFTFQFHALEKEMATHSSVLAWRIPGTGEPGGLPSMRSHRVGHDWSDLA